MVLYDIATGGMSERPQSQVADLDRPGAAPICPRLRARLGDSRTGYSDGVFAEATQPIRIYRCHGRPTILRGRGEVGNLQLSAGLLTWDSGHDAETFKEGEDASDGTLSSYRLATHQRQSWRLPRLHLPIGPEHPVVRAFGYSAHTANTVFWIATRTLVFGESGFTVGTSTVYAEAL